MPFPSVQVPPCWHPFTGQSLVSNTSKEKKGKEQWRQMRLVLDSVPVFTYQLRVDWSEKNWKKKPEWSWQKIITFCWKSLRQDPLEAILVIFGRRALIFFWFESSWKNMKNDTTFVRLAQWWSPWRPKYVEKGHLAPSNLIFFINCDRQKRFSQNERRRADLQNLAWDFKFLLVGT